MMRRYRLLLPYLWRQWPGLLAIASVTLLSSLQAALQPWPLKVLVDYGLGQAQIPALLQSALGELGLAPTPSGLIIMAAALALCLYAANSVTTSFLTWKWTTTGQGMVAGLAGDLFERLQRLPLRFHQRHPPGDSLSRLTEDCWCVYKLTDGVLISPAQKLFTLATLGLVAWRLHAELALYALLTAPLMALTTVYFGNRIRRRARQGREAQARLMSFVHQTLSSMPIVQAFGTEDRNRQRYQNLAADAVALSQRGSLQSSAYRLVTGFISTTGLAVIVWVGGRQVLAGTLTLGSFLVFLAYMRTLQNTAESLVRLHTSLKPIEASMDRVLEIIQAQPDQVREHPLAKPFPRRAGQGAAVTLAGVTYGYEPGRPVLHDVKLQAASGEVVALVGGTGAGKTTLVSLIMRLFDPWEGHVVINGVDAKEIQLQELRRHVAVVLQEPFLLPLTIAQNIAYGRPEATRAEIEAAARAACAHDFIVRLPQGYETVIGQRGTTLSGGERQRVAIARAYLKDAPILILDEPTSALDGRTETSFLEALEQLRRRRTVLVIAHRLSTIRRADQIVVLESGRIVQRGRHAELVRAGGVYERLHRLQVGPPPEEVGAL